jgi:uncharacterized protein YydD (DUF2326 family)
MFKLISLSSPTRLFEPIIFKDGLNIILGKYTKSGKDINGIGKTTIIHLIDYCLLADGVKSEFFSPKYSFLKKEEVKLDFMLGADMCSIERGFSDKRQVYFQVNNNNPVEYIDTDLRLILGAEIGRGQHGIYDPIWFRTLMSFFIQNDHNFQARDSKNVLKFTAGKRQPELLTFIFFILGIDNSLIWNFDDKTVELKGLRSDQSRLTTQVVEKTGKSVEYFRAECDLTSRRLEKLEEGLNQYQFSENTSDLEQKIQILNSKISVLNKEHLHLLTKFRNIQDSLRIELDVDPVQVAGVYASIHSEFSSFIKRSLEEVIQFRKEITSNRNRFLAERESEYQNRLSAIKKMVASAEIERSKIYKDLDAHAAFDALKSAYANLIDEKSRFASHLTYLQQLDEIEEKIADKKSDVGNVVAEMVSNKNRYTEALDEIKTIFLDLVEGSVDIDGADVTPFFNIDFKANQQSPVQVKLEVPRGGSLGKGRFKILAFDLTVFLSSLGNQSDLPRFLIHDGVFHAIAHKTRIKFLNYINKKLNSLGNAQYIITVNEDEITFPEHEGVSVSIDFNLDEKILLTLGDDPDHMFFGREFG